MLKKQDLALLPADTEFERTLRSLRKTKEQKTQPWKMKDMTRQRSKGQQQEGLL